MMKIATLLAAAAVSAFALRDPVFSQEWYVIRKLACICVIVLIGLFCVLHLAADQAGQSCRLVWLAWWPAFKFSS